MATPVRSMRYLWSGLLAAGLLAQQAQSPPKPQFQGSSHLVILPTTVTDSRGRAVDGLDVADFAVLDNGKAQTITVDTIGTGVAPIALVIAVQSSGISAAVLEKLQNISSIIQPLITGTRGCVAVLTFSDRVNWLQQCTDDANALDVAFLKLRAGSYRSARMLDASLEAIQYLEQRPNARRVLLLISEARDRGSDNELPLVTAAAQSAGVVIYAATYSALKTGFTSRNPVRQQELKVQRPLIMNPFKSWNGAAPSWFNPMIVPPADRLDLGAGLGELVRLRKIDDTQILTGGTGGTTFRFTRQKALEAALHSLGSELHQQYMLSFTPESAPPGYHILEVRIAGHAGLSIRARPGYWWAGSQP